VQAKEEGGGKMEDQLRATATRKPIRNFRDLEVYQRAQRLMVEVHRLVLQFPDYEKRGVTDQLRRSSKSVGALICEGWGLHESIKEFKNYLRRAKGSANETEGHLETALALGYGDPRAGRRLTQEYALLAGQLKRLAENWRAFNPPSSILPLPSPRSSTVRARAE
jgi:four helix bundle protein